MAKKQLVPINTKILEWAIQESGLSKSDISKKFNIDKLNNWLSGKDKLGLTEFKKICSVLKRPSAIFFLPEPPKTHLGNVEFRHHPNYDRNDLNYKEATYLRSTNRLKELISWTHKQEGNDKHKFPKISIEYDPEEISSHIIKLLNIDYKSLFDLESPSKALKFWRTELERNRVYTFLYPIGEDSVRGFSLYDDYSPVIAINTTGWNTESRIFSMFHELGHIITRSNSACSMDMVYIMDTKYDPTEKWCDKFASAFLMPAYHIKDTLGFSNIRYVNDLKIARILKNKFKVSLSSVVLRLIQLNLADWSLYKQIQIAPKKKKSGFGKPRNSVQIKKDMYGDKTFDTILGAYKDNLINLADASSFLELKSNDVLKLL